MYKDQNLVERYKDNPILSKKDIPYKADLIFNAGVTKYHGVYYMIFRNDYKGYPCDNNGLAGTNLGLAISKDGIHFKVDKKIRFAMKDNEIKRIYDPRLQVIDDQIFMCFACDTKHGIRGGIGKLNKSFSKLEIISLTTPDNRNMVLFPEKINGKYVRLERPFPVYSRHGEYFDIWMSESSDLKYWGNSKLVLGSEQVKFANYKIGPGTPPIKTKKGWLALFHAVEFDPNRGKNGWEKKWQKIYYTGVMLLSLKDPSKVIGLYQKPLLAPSTSYERIDGFRNDVIFPGGLILEENGEVKIYYGAADTVECVAFSTVNELLKLCQKK